MPIVEVEVEKTYKGKNLCAICEDCKATTKPVAFLSEIDLKWVAVTPLRGTDTYFTSYRVFCPDCAKKRGISI